MDSLPKNLKEQVTCSICQGTFTDPKTITCLHTFCCECIKKHALISQRNGKFRCPECQAEVDVPAEANRFDKLPTSFYHNSLLSVLAIQQSGKGIDIRCGICKENSAEISYCFECAKFICTYCVNAHQQSVSIKHGLRTADYGLRTGYKIRTRYKTRTRKYGLGIKHGQGIKRGLRTADWV